MRRAVDGRSCVGSTVPLLRQARELLSQSCLSPTQMKSLARVTEMLIDYAVTRLHSSLSGYQPSRAVERLGIRFLLLDVVVSTLTVLGQKPDPGPWKIFTDAIGHGAPLTGTGRLRRGRPNISVIRARELSRAIQILKTGKRPEPSDLVQIKRMLFCWTSSPTYFRRGEFDPWREDDNFGDGGP
ncbi:uncharacterized protein EMH_0052850 [Eimeria mitis]|uniref:Uncharacterized protein n=1 Tax=Eimeria mitis TaxID=44415 RepID=U6JWJ5_9EIME|nr:uncharacterized protein EMH_0052850 [Eimeria mitis]CDJ29804.1 hypothetical protein EMH_0052850 [Eimeria mitis]